MQNFIAFLTVMALQQGQCQLSKQFPGHFFRNIHPWPGLGPSRSGVLEQLPLSLDQRSQVATRAVLHDDVKPCLLLVDYPVVVASYIWVLQLSEDVDL